MAQAHSIHNVNRTDALEALARVGYAAKGFVYLFVGGLALMYAFGEGGALTGKEGAVKSIGQQPAGEVLLWATAIGLIGYAIWKFIQAAVDPEHAGSDAKGIGKRIGWAASGVLHGALAVLAIQLASGNGSGGGGETWLHKVMEAPGGQALVMVAAIGVLIAAFVQFKEGYRAEFTKCLRMNEMSHTEKVWAIRAGRLGLMARGVVFAIIGYFLFRAGAEARSSEAKGMGEALQTVASQSYGKWLLGIMAIGLIAYAVHSFFDAKYRRIDARV